MRLPVLVCLGALLLAVPAHAQDSAEITFWESVKDSKDPAELQAYLDAYPQGKFAALARIRIGALGGTPRSGPAAQAPAVITPAPTAPSGPAVEATPPAQPAAPTAQAPGAGVETPAAAEVQWHEIRPPEGGFAALFPGEPVLGVNPPDEKGHSQHRFLVEQGDSAFMVAYDDYPPGHLNATGAPAVLDTARNALLKAMNGTLREENPIALAGRPGREILFDTPDHTAGRVRVYLGGNRLYQIWFMGPAGHEAGPEADRFFGSFKFTAAATAEAPTVPEAAPNAPAAEATPPAQPPAPQGPAAAQAAWQEFRPAKGGFAILLPGEPKATVTPPDASGRSQSRFLVDQGDTAWIVAYDDYPPGQLAKANPAVLLDAAQGALLKGLNGTLRQRRPLAIAGFPGREIVFDTPDHNSGKVRVYVVKNRLYQTWYMGPSGQEAQLDVDRFLNSFQLTSR